MTKIIVLVLFEILPFQVFASFFLIFAHAHALALFDDSNPLVNICPCQLTAAHELVNESISIFNENF